jgi:hypothetical protein
MTTLTPTPSPKGEGSNASVLPWENASPPLENASLLPWEKGRG